MRIILLLLLPISLLANSADRTRAINAMNKGHFKDALPIFQALLQSDDPQPNDLHSAVNCMQQLGQFAARDATCEQAIDAKPNDWRMLLAAAQLYMAEPHSGGLVDGKFERGYNYGGQQEIRYSYQRDRVCALQLYQRIVAMEKIPQHVFAQIAALYQQSRALDSLTDLSRLPELETQESYYHYHRQSQRSPVGPEGKPIFFEPPASFAESANDGERWMWLRQKAGQLRRDHGAAQFLHAQFGVQTLQNYGWKQDENDRDRQSGILALHTLADDETIAHTAGGIQRFKLPLAHNYIAMYQEMAETGDVAAMQTLSQIYLNRRQYPRAAKQIQTLLRKKRRGVKQDEYHLRQIFNNWGAFDPAKPFPAGRPPSLNFRFRNAESVIFSARRIDMSGLIAEVQRDVKRASRSHPGANLESLGTRIISEGRDGVVGAQVASWKAELKPDPEHFDRSIAISAPEALAKPGVYLIEARVKRGNTARIIIRVEDCALVRKSVDGKIWYFVADAVSGAPIPNAEIEFFGFEIEYVRKRLPLGRKLRAHTTSFSHTTDENGQLYLTNEAFEDKDRSYQWMAVARAGERLAHLGVENLWPRAYSPKKYQDHKTFIITDRPVYRPGQVLKYKAWTHVAKYDDRLLSYEGKKGEVYISDPKGDNKLKASYRADAFGGGSGEWTIPADAVLGQYRIHTAFGGSLHFRVEEYKKPEFEVTIETPDKPVTLGERAQVAISANYYFGAPVAEGHVKLRVLRSSQSSTHYPQGRWDWLYGRGYWWNSYEYPWCDGWERWGCGMHFWWYEEPEPPPEVVLEMTKPIGADGRLEFTIDTALAKAMKADSDHRYEISAEVTDASRRTIVGQGSVMAARQPFRIYAWIDRGFAQAGDTVTASFSARSVDDKPVSGPAELRLLRVRYKEGRAVEEEVGSWDLTLDEEGTAEQRFVTAAPGQYRLSMTHAGVEGGSVFQVRGPQTKTDEYRFAKLELIPEKSEYAPGETVRLLVNTDQADATVLLFVRAIDGTYPKPRVLTLDGKSGVAEFAVTVDDHPNIFVEAVTVYGAETHTTVREIIVPPQKQTLDVEILPSAERYKPGEKATVKLRLTDHSGEPYQGAMALTLYDRALEYIARAAYPDIHSFYWEWRRRHQPRTIDSLSRLEHEALKPDKEGMRPIGIFGHMVGYERESRMMEEVEADSVSASAPMARATLTASNSKAPVEVKPVVRRNFADSAYWNGEILTNANGEAEISLSMPDNLTDWQLRCWAVGERAKCGEASVSVATAKNLLLRMQAPRFFVEKDIVTLSANVHNYLDSAKQVRVVLEHDEKLAWQAGEFSQTVEIPAGGEARVDWRMRVAKEGETLILMKALSDEESDAMEMRFPVKVHGAPRTESFSGHLRPDAESASLSFSVPRARRVLGTTLEINYTPTLAGAMIDSLPYLAEFPYGCTEQTLNRFLPTVIVRKMLIDMGIELEDLEGRKGRPVGPRKNPIYDSAKVDEMIKVGVERLAEMQLRSGGWGWFSGLKERTYRHTTAVVLRGLLIARDSDVAIPSGMIAGGVAWLKRNQQRRLRELRKKKGSVQELDAYVHRVLVEAGVIDLAMSDALFAGRRLLSTYSQCLLAAALHKTPKRVEQVPVMRALIEQRLLRDEENQTAQLNLENSGYWWRWYGSEFEAHAAYLKLLALIEPKSDTASGLVKYLLNNRRHGTWWNSTRDTAYIVEAFGDYIRASGEAKPEMDLDLVIDGKLAKTVHIDRENLLNFDNSLILADEQLSTGEHTLELRRRGSGPLYFTAYLSYFSLQDPIPAAGLEVKVSRQHYKIVGDDRIKLADSAEVVSGDVIEVELSIDSKNDYEYLLIEDFKPAGFEGLDLTSAWITRGMHAYLEMRDDRAAFFVKELPQGRHNLSYRLRAEMPGRFSALPAQISGMYAPELRGNSAEAKLQVVD